MAFDPNGMVMDLLRSCYSQNVMYFNGDPSQVTKCRWYFAARTAKPFPAPHAFGSPTWDTVHPTSTTLGWDATSSRSYYNGKRSNTSDGTSFAGPLDFFQNGADTLADLDRGVNGTPVVCLRSPVGVALGGGVSVLPSTITPSCFPHPIPLVASVDFYNVNLFGPSCSIPQYTGTLTFDPNWREFPGWMVYPNGGWHGTFTRGKWTEHLGFGCGTVSGFSAAWFVDGYHTSAYVMLGGAVVPGPPRYIGFGSSILDSLLGLCTVGLYQMNMKVFF